MTNTDRAYEALGRERSELARYKQQNAEQQKRIRQLEAALKDFLDSFPQGIEDDKTGRIGFNDDFKNKFRRAAAILKGK